jgi:hypothetical protein
MPFTCNVRSAYKDSGDIKIECAISHTQFPHKIFNKTFTYTDDATLETDLRSAIQKIKSDHTESENLKTKAQGIVDAILIDING